MNAPVVARTVARRTEGGDRPTISERTWTCMLGGILAVTGFGLLLDARMFNGWGEYYFDAAHWMIVAGIVCLITGSVVVLLGLRANQAPARFAAVGLAFVTAGLTIPAAQVASGHEWPPHGEDVGTDRGVLYMIIALVVLAVGGSRLGRAARMSPVLGLLAVACLGVAVGLAMGPSSMVYSTGAPTALRWVAVVVLAVAEAIGLARRPPARTAPSSPSSPSSTGSP